MVRCGGTTGKREATHQGDGDVHLRHVLCLFQGCERVFTHVLWLNTRKTGISRVWEEEVSELFHAEEHWFVGHVVRRGDVLLLVVVVEKRIKGGRSGGCSSSSHRDTIEIAATPLQIDGSLKRPTRLAISRQTVVDDPLLEHYERHISYLCKFNTASCTTDERGRERGGSRWFMDAISRKASSVQAQVLAGDSGSPLNVERSNPPSALPETRRAFACLRLGRPEDQ